MKNFVHYKAPPVLESYSTEWELRFLIEFNSIVSDRFNEKITERIFSRDKIKELVGINEFLSFGDRFYRLSILSKAMGLRATDLLYELEYPLVLNFDFGFYCLKNIGIAIKPDRHLFYSLPETVIFNGAQIMPINLQKCQNLDNNEFVCMIHTLMKDSENCLKNPRFCAREIKSTKEYEKSSVEISAGIGFSSLSKCEVYHSELNKLIISRPLTMLFIPRIPDCQYIKCSNAESLVTVTHEFSNKSENHFIRILFDMGDAEYENVVKNMKFIDEEGFEFESSTELEYLLFNTTAESLSLISFLPNGWRNVNNFDIKTSLGFLCRVIFEDSKFIKWIPLVLLVPFFLILLLICFVVRKIKILFAKLFHCLLGN